METVSEYRKKYHVDYGDADYYKNLKISALFNYFQDIASIHAENLGLGLEFLQEELGVTWVLVKILVKIERLPKLNEEIYLETWPLEPKKLEFERDFYVRDMEGNILVKAISSWVIMDIENREIKKTEELPSRLPQFNTERAIDGRIGKIKGEQQPIEVYKKVIGYSDIDINGHLNNSKYIDYITDCFSLEEHRRNSVDSIQVNYLNEAFAGDSIILFRDVSKRISNVVYVEGMNEAGSKTYFKANITLKQAD